MRRRTFLIAAGATGLLPGPLFGEPGGFPRLDVRQDIAAAAANLSREFGRHWPGAPDAHFLVLLVGAEREFLLHASSLPEGFAVLGDDPLTGLPVYHRPRQFEPSLLATFPAVLDYPTIVIGFPEATEQVDRADWTLTLFHEHFHQRQYSEPLYYQRTAALDLADGDETGMWMLNYPFPYREPATAEGFAAAATSLGAALAGGAEEVRSFLARRAQWRATVSERDWRYFAFQCWQEGVARFAEIELARQSGNADWIAAAGRKVSQIRHELARPDIGERRRIAVYSYGAAEAMLLTRRVPGWRSDYFSGPMSLDHHFDAISAQG